MGELIFEQTLVEEISYDQERFQCLQDSWQALIGQYLHCYLLLNWPAYHQAQQHTAPIQWAHRNLLPLLLWVIRMARK